MSRAAAIALGLAAAAIAGCGGSSADDKPATQKVDPFSVVPAAPSDRAVATRKAAPRWERVALLQGTGNATRSVTIARGAIQWRTRATCARGTLRLSPAGAAGADLATTGACPAPRSTTGVRSGALKLAIATPGRWTVIVEQQVDTALHEAPLAAMSAAGARIVARGSFYDIERFGRGEAVLHRLAGGRLALRLQRFVTSSNVDLHLWLDRAVRPRTTVQAQRARHRDVALLKSTIGEQNYLLPAGTTPADVRSVVIWCDPVQIAYTAATMRPG